MRQSGVISYLIKIVAKIACQASYKKKKLISVAIFDPIIDRSGDLFAISSTLTVLTDTGLEQYDLVISAIFFLPAILQYDRSQTRLF